VIPGTWSHAALVTLLLAIAAGLLTLRPKKRGASRVKRVHHIVDYSAARSKAIAWLGDDYLLARPINRLYQSELPAMLKRQAD
jgi:hypothetical protein